MKLNSSCFVNRFVFFLLPLLMVTVLSGCAGRLSWLPSPGPSATQVKEVATSANDPNIQIVDVNAAVARKLLISQKQNLFSEVFKAPPRAVYVIGTGDVLEVSIWEAPPAVLFGSGVVDARAGSSTARVTTFPEQMVNRAGTINIPFAGLVVAEGRTPQQIEADIVARLKGKAHQPQVLVRIIRNNNANVTVVGEVASSLRMPLTARGERLLDALAAAGGVRQPVSKTTLQVTRGDQVQSMPLEAIIRDPKQNIILRSGDVVTSLFQPLSFTVLGATGKNEEINFEAHGISLAQALARAGGLQDTRADAQGVFIFRFESPAALDSNITPTALTADGKIPVIYRVDFKDPATFFVAQGFPIYNKDVVFVSNAPAAELQKFLNIVGSVFYPVATAINLSK